MVTRVPHKKKIKPWAVWDRYLNMHEYMYNTVYEYFWLFFFLFSFIWQWGSKFNWYFFRAPLYNLCTFEEFYLIISSALPCKINVTFNLHLCSLIQMFECIFSSKFYLSVCILYTNSNIGAQIVPVMNGASNF
jgi:hypothetical protein